MFLSTHSHSALLHPVAIEDTIKRRRITNIGGTAEPEFHVISFFPTTSSTCGRLQWIIIGVQ